MGRRKQIEVPALERLGGRFAVWRKNRSVGERIPESLWNAAARTAAKHGLNRTARALKLDYYSLKKQVDRVAAKGKLRKFLLGDSSEKASKLLGDEDDKQQPSPGNEDTDSDASDSKAGSGEAPSDEPARGHGRPRRG